MGYKIFPVRLSSVSANIIITIVIPLDVLGANRAVESVLCGSHKDSHIRKRGIFLQGVGVPCLESQLKSCGGDPKFIFWTLTKLKLPKITDIPNGYLHLK